ncbi:MULTISPECIES: helix-turn-helix domain-containing protein [Chryseobacterium]|uniref:Transcriptional regulator with XRE-family HTH domain n=1 Tax=Chryseobacterium camelliae TaxID=1265445 RepID=A0ABU0TKF1_9FLAO|nr:MULTISPECIES: helix-turn-helix transcriptional regulator [Chryseobacterium]MDT3408623.1 transcriptional regulator with XRE-family HTH domain [Pseudacidovorax intermedius]MDQ1097522.1 transcriptional regulator with XRE-family HTH domain [Chryseobacterium camelliae]MDQ1101451.1 transcriptional regulator with XRE-family HTH domain [Chryseobacterium sp. SORGH_AS_1048]MDR6084895.1 transcriptional regulator with XRE-family HTH domain [Chryseobacterium sp. SORGH_AS_0909]MDR6129247.1 transcriptiona
MQKEKLRLLRKRKGYTQKDIAEVIATDVSNYSRKESGDVRIIKDEWEKIAKFLNVSVDEIYEEDEPRVIVNNENPVFNDNAVSAGVMTQFNSISTSVIQNLQDYIDLLKKEIDRLNEEVQELKNK